MTTNTKPKANSSESLSDQLRLFLKTELASLAVSKIDIEDGLDHDGTEVINIVVRHKLINKPLNFKSLFGTDGRVRDLAWELGERRFVHVRHVLNKNQKLAA